MAEVSEGSFMGRTAERAGTLVQYAGATVSVALIIGVGYWGYKLFVRDVTGVPVVRAMEGPMRQAPADPGGEMVMNTGLSVNEVAAEGEAAAPEDVLLLAPVSNGLAPEDMEVQSMAEAGEVMASDFADGDRLGNGDLSQVSLETDPASPDAAITQANLAIMSDTPLTADQVLALADQIAAGATPFTELAAGADVPVALAVDGAAMAAEAAITLISADVPGVAVALRPPARPSTMAVLAAPAPAVATTAEVTTAVIPPGTFMVQLGAFDTAEIAAAEWDRVNARFAEFMVGKERIIQTTERNGGTFYRLRAMGFTDRDDTLRFCAVLDAEGTNCVPAVAE